MSVHVYRGYVLISVGDRKKNHEWSKEIYMFTSGV